MFDLFKVDINCLYDFVFFFFCEIFWSVVFLKYVFIVGFCLECIFVIGVLVEGILFLGIFFYLVD